MASVTDQPTQGAKKKKQFTPKDRLQAKLVNVPEPVRVWFGEYYNLSMAEIPTDKTSIIEMIHANKARLIEMVHADEREEEDVPLTDDEKREQIELISLDAIKEEQMLNAMLARHKEFVSGNSRRKIEAAKAAQAVEPTESTTP